MRREGFFVQTQVRNMKVKSRAARLEVPLGESARVEELPRRGHDLGKKLLRLDQLARNLAVVGCLFLVVVAVRNTSAPEAQSVFGALKEGAGMEWDESVGKLSFVNSLLPQSIQAVWNERDVSEVFAPVSGDVVHAWSQAEPYLMIQSGLTDVRAAADGEAISIAHGLDEERIVRIRHDDDTETLYGNLEACYVEVGDRVQAGQIFAGLLDGQPLSFELRVDGRSVDPEGKLLPVAP